MTGSSTPTPAAKHESYNAQFPALPPRSQRLPNTRDSNYGSIERELTVIMNVQLVRPLCPSPTYLRKRVVDVITCTGWNPPISSVDRAKWKDAYNAYHRANVEFDTTARLGEFPPLMSYPPVHK
jgi:hypothetical protein